MDPRRNLPFDERAVGRLVDGAIRAKRSDQGRAASTKLHVHRITRSGEWAGTVCQKPRGSGASVRGTGTSPSPWFSEITVKKTVIFLNLAADCRILPKICKSGFR